MAMTKKSRRRRGSFSRVRDSKSIVIPKLRKGYLNRYGYNTKDTVQKRRTALKKAIKNYEALSVFRKLNAVFVLNKNTNPSTASKFKADRDWVRKNYMNSKGKSPRKSRKRKSLTRKSKRKSPRKSRKRKSLTRKSKRKSPRKSRKRKSLTRKSKRKSPRKLKR
jgi:hypothetical protein